MTVTLECSDCSPSCQPQNENNFFVIYNRKYDALKTKKENKSVKDRASFLLSQNVQNTKKERRKKLSNSNHYKRRIIFIVFILLVIKKRK